MQIQDLIGLDSQVSFQVETGFVPVTLSTGAWSVDVSFDNFKTTIISDLELEVVSEKLFKANLETPLYFSLTQVVEVEAPVEAPAQSTEEVPVVEVVAGETKSLKPIKK